MRILHAPLHGPTAARHTALVARAIRGQRPDSAGLTEAYPTPVRRALDRMPGYRTVVEAGGRDRRRGQYDNPIVVRTGLRSFGSGQLYGCAASTPAKIAPERWLTWSTVDLDDRPVCHIAVHFHAAIQAPDGRLVRHDRGAKALDELIALDTLLEFTHFRRWAVVVTGDVNFRDRPQVAGSNPHSVLRRHGLTVDAHGLDLIAHDPSLGLEVTEVPAPQAITDHPWLLATSR